MEAEQRAGTGSARPWFRVGSLKRRGVPRAVPADILRGDASPPGSPRRAAGPLIDAVTNRAYEMGLIDYVLVRTVKPALG
jgi:hypothetical protein